MATTVSSPQPGGLSALFNLSQAAASAPPIPVGHDTSKALKEKESKELLSGKQGHALKHRRLSSTGQKARRMSDAREAVTRTGCVDFHSNFLIWTDVFPYWRPANLHIAASALSSLASLSLSAASSVPAPVSIPIRHTRSRSQLNGQNSSFSPSSYDVNVHFNSMDMHLHNLGALASSVPNPPFAYAASSVGGDDIEVDVEDDLDDNVSVIESVTGNGGKRSKKDGKDGKPTKGKKRGTIFKCESCSKVRTLNTLPT